MKRLFDKLGCFLVAAFVFPAGNVEIILVIAESLTLGCLILCAEVTAAAFVTVQSVVSDKFAHCDEVVETERLVKLDIHTLSCSGHEKIGVESLADLFELLKRKLKTLFVTCHADVFHMM